MNSPSPSRPAKRDLFLPFILTAVIIILDQVSKAIIVANVPRVEFTGYTIPVIGDFLRIIHTRNLAIAFSIGRALPEGARRLLFTVIPTVVVAGLVIYYVRERTFTRLQRWAVAGILGGGTGNLIDRVFRSEGVVDFVDVKFYGIFGMERWPTFNVADAAVVVCGILLILAMLIQPASTEAETSEESSE